MQEFVRFIFLPEVLGLAPRPQHLYSMDNFHKNCTCNATWCGGGGWEWGRLGGGGGCYKTACELFGHSGTVSWLRRDTSGLEANMSFLSTRKTRFRPKVLSLVSRKVVQVAASHHLSSSRQSARPLVDSHRRSTGAVSPAFSSSCCLLVGESGCLKGPASVRPGWSASTVSLLRPSAMIRSVWRSVLTDRRPGRLGVDTVLVAGAG